MELFKVHTLSGLYQTHVCAGHDKISLYLLVWEPASPTATCILLTPPVSRDRCQPLKGLGPQEVRDGLSNWFKKAKLRLRLDLASVLVPVVDQTDTTQVNLEHRHVCLRTDEPRPRLLTPSEAFDAMLNSLDLNTSCICGFGVVWRRRRERKNKLSRGGQLPKPEENSQTFVL